jgi:uncharacterized protein (DUF433 family)
MALTIHPDPVPLRVDADGVVRVGGARVSLDVILAHHHQGASAEEIAERFPVLTLADVHAALAYYLRHRDEIDHYLAEQVRQADDAVQALGGRHQPWSEVHDRLGRRRQGP